MLFATLVNKHLPCSMSTPHPHTIQWFAKQLFPNWPGITHGGHHWYWSLLVKIMAWWIFGTRPLFSQTQRQTDQFWFEIKQFSYMILTKIKRNQDYITATFGSLLFSIYTWDICIQCMHWLLSLPTAPSLLVHAWFMYISWINDFWFLFSFQIKWLLQNCAYDIFRSDNFTSTVYVFMSW